MWKRLITSCMSMVFLLSCSHLHKIKNYPTESVMSPGVPSFHQVKVVGNLNVLIHTNARHQGIHINGDPQDVAGVIWSVKNNILYVELSNKKSMNGPIMVEINTKYLTSFVYNGNGSITGYNLKTNALDLAINNSGNTTLSGKIGLRTLRAAGTGEIRINGVKTYFLNLNLAGHVRVAMKGVINVASCNMKDASWVSLYWVKSHHLTVRNHGNSFAQLAGVADTLDVELWDTARFNGKYLRGKRSFVKTHNKSQADIFAVNSQHTLATDTSNIYFYNLATMKADFMAYNGSVLDLREWDRPYFQEPTPYNL